jgi:hypothetical protein
MSMDLTLSSLTPPAVVLSDLSAPLVVTAPVVIEAVGPVVLSAPTSQDPAPLGLPPLPTS